MIVEEIMHTDVATLKPNDSIKMACELIHVKRIKHIPVVNDENQVIGIISDRDVRDVSPSVFNFAKHTEAFEKPVASIMTENVITAHPLDFVEEIAAAMNQHDISCLPIVSDDQLVGIVTETDLLYTLVQLTGADQPSSRIEVKIENKTGVLAEVTSVFKKCKVNIISVFTYPDKNQDYRILVFRVKTINPMGVITELKNEGYTVLWPNLPGVSS